MMRRGMRWFLLAGFCLVSFYLPGTVQAMAFTGIEDAAFLSGEEPTEVTTADGREVRFMNTQLSTPRANGRPAYELLVAGAEDSHMLLQLGSGPYVTIRQVYTDEDGTSFFELLATSQAEQGFVRAFYLIGLQPHRGIVYVRLPDFYAIGLNRGKAHLAESFVDDAGDYIVQFWGPINMRAGKEPENLQVDLKARLFWDDDSRWVSADCVED